ncbi:hypothetical protein N7450_010172 [Penicillium hetheringtonii]|uniref:Alpha/beta hydrolase fold-3 domain-containing protein n=1 Tax=Penicillium hetheringtonii TaxID=911720 RepID=A0AAD6GP32_9EURO|nr:hypothetical protein N7450_010172 [Penicillium hetheringtonii]
MWRITLLFRNIYLRITVTFLRTVYKLTRPTTITTNLHTKLQIPSRDKGRYIQAHLYTKNSISTTHTNNNTANNPQPILLNFHGSAMIFPAFGTDNGFCTYISKTTNHLVLDINYQKSPENPFPAALNDIQDSIQWILSQPHKYNQSQISLSGFSSGGNLAIVAATSLFPKDTFHSILTFYPGVDMASDPSLKVAPDKAGKLIPPAIARFFHNCYIPPGIDARDPRISPIFADLRNFSSRLLIVTAARDNMAPEAEEFGLRVERESGSEVVVKRMEECEHGWDKNLNAGEVQEEAKWRAYSLAVDMLEK